MSSLLGVTDQRRQIAATYGVDPYTDLPPLSRKAPAIVASGGDRRAGGDRRDHGRSRRAPASSCRICRPPTSSTISASRRWRANTPPRRSSTSIATLLEKMGVEAALSESCLSNRNYTPIDMAAMVAALDSHERRADTASCSSRGRRRPMAAPSPMSCGARRNCWPTTIAAMAAMCGSCRSPTFPMCMTRDGRLMALLPIDALSWTRETAIGFIAVSNARKAVAPQSRGELRITGMATAMAKGR